MSEARPPTALWILGEGEVAKTWASLAEASPVIDTCTLTGALAPGEWAEGLEGGPGATALPVLCLAPTAAARALEALASSGASAPKVQLPVRGPLSDRAALAGALAPTLDAPGLAVVRRWLAEPGITGVTLLLRGSFSRRWADLYHRLQQIGALAAAIWPEAAPSSGRQGTAPGVYHLRLDPVPFPVEVVLQPEGEGLELEVRSPGGARRYGLRLDREWTEKGGRRSDRKIPPPAQRALGAAVSGAPAPTVGAVLAWADAALAALGLATELGPATLEEEVSASLADRLGILDPLPSAEGPVPEIALPVVDLPWEVFAFQAGLKPAIFLTLTPDQEPPVRAALGEGVAVLREERRVAIGAQDRWDDRRGEGAPRVELYVSRDPALAEEARRLQAEGDPSASLKQLGALLGYPACCVAAFARQSDRANNSWNKYAPALGDAPRPWAPELNLFVSMPIPFFPCSYGCEAAVAWARTLYEHLAQVRPQAAAALAALQRRPLLYFDHECQLAFDGVARPGEEHGSWEINFDGVQVPPWSPPEFRRFAAGLAQHTAFRATSRHFALKTRRNEWIYLSRRAAAPGLVGAWRAFS